MMKCGIVDAHHHFWDLRNEYPWLTHSPNPGLDITPFAKDYLPDEYENDARPLKIARSVHIEAGWRRSDTVSETRWLTELHEKTGRPNAIVAYADLSNETAGQVLARHAGFAMVRGIRMLLTWHPDPNLRRAARPDFLTDRIWLDSLARFAEHGFSFDMQLFPMQMRDALGVVRTHPETRFIIDHLGLPVDRSEIGMQAWRDGLIRLAEYDNVAIKLSGFFHFLGKWSREAARPYVEFALKTFGAGRCMFGSNYPVDRSFVAMPKLVEDLASLMDETSIERIFSANAIKWYRLDE